MAGIYPDDQPLNIYGQPVTWPGMDPDTGKFTNGDFTDPLKKPSFIPAESINLILDNLSELIKSMSVDGPNNQAIDQLVKLFTSAATPKKGIVRDENGRAKVESPSDSYDIVNLGYLNNSQVGNIVSTMINDAEMANRRYLPLNGQVVQIAGNYQNLFNVVYSGDTAQQTAQAFYKCDLDGKRNPGGLYFKLPNVNGRVVRGTGQGDFIKDKDGVDTVDHYEGGNIGDSIGDAIRNISGHVGYPFVANLQPPSPPFYSSGTINVSAQTGSPEHFNVFMDLSRSVPTATWNRDSSISARICIIY